MKKIYFDTEFTGLHQQTSLISIGLIADTGETFYAEFDDYEEGQCDDWIKQHVISSLSMTQEIHWITCTEHPENRFSIEMKNNSHKITPKLITWLKQFDEKLIMYSDCLAYDWVLFCELFGGAILLPDWICYTPMDLSTAFAMKGIDPDISREEFAEIPASAADKHNAMWDARVIKACFEKLE